MEHRGPENRRVSVDLSEGFGERLLGQLLDRPHEMPPQLIAPLVAEEVARVGGREVSILLQCYEQLELVPLPGRGLTIGEAVPIDGSRAGEVFLSLTAVEDVEDDGVRMYLPLLDGSDEVGAMALTLASMAFVTEAFERPSPTHPSSHRFEPTLQPVGAEGRD